MPCACCLGWVEDEEILWHETQLDEVSLVSGRIYCWKRIADNSVYGKAWYFFCQNCRDRATQIMVEDAPIVAYHWCILAQHRFEAAETEPR